MIKAFAGHSVVSMEKAIEKALRDYDDWRTTHPNMVAQLTDTAIAIVPGDGQNQYWYTLTMVLFPLEPISGGRHYGWRS